MGWARNMNGRGEKYTQVLSRKPEGKKKVVELSVDYVIILRWI